MASNFAFNGRIGRRDYVRKALVPWWIVLAAGVGAHILTTAQIDSMTGILIRDIVWGIFLVGMAVAYVGAANKRWHDLGRSAKWNYALLFPPMFLVLSPREWG